MLSQHPDALRKLRTEILTVVGKSRCPTLEDMREMKYLKAVINGTSCECLGNIINSRFVKKLCDYIPLCKSPLSLRLNENPDQCVL